jgi:tryptophan halogenase
MELCPMGKKTMNKSIIVVGGGTAGWITALYLKKLYNYFNITVIESKEIGILGAGEGSTPTLVDFLHSVDIPLEDILKNCDATIKNGVKFTNWNNDDKFYYHPFWVNPVTGLSIDGLESNLRTSPLVVSSIFKNKTCLDIDFMAKISEKNKVPFIPKKNNKDNLIDNYETLANYSIHFNATKFADRLKQIGIDRGIKVIDGVIKDVNLDQKCNVESLTLENNAKVFCDFIFDCSGFHRLVIGKTFKSKWKSYNEFLPVNAAVPFFIKQTEEIPPYTEAIAMRYGWMWKIPLQNRFGCGYVYDSSLISEYDAIKEIEEYLGYEPQYPRKDKGGFSFSAGCYEETWINNCVAVGLASNFIEPLEATSIALSLMLLKRLLGSPEWLFEDNKKIRDEFNKNILEMNSSTVEFIYFHYLGERKDTKFWEKFSYDHAPEKLKEKIDLWQQRFPSSDDESTYNTYRSWLLIGLGLNIVNKDIAEKYIEGSDKYKHWLKSYDYLVNLQNNKLKQCTDHREFLEGLK